ncbi:MAG TPA: DUF1269 domain-containing protein [Baekduia sp.]|jgi:uncharacterized membrane protein
MSDLVAIAYPDLATAEQVARNLGEARKAHLIEIEDAVLVEHQAGGKVKLHQPSLARTGAAGGAIWGGLIGMLFLAPVVGAAIGAAAGGATGAMIDSGIDDDFMKDLGAKLLPGAAALVLLVGEMVTERLLSEIRIPGEIVQTSLDGETETALRDALARAGQPA